MASTLTFAVRVFLTTHFSITLPTELLPHVYYYLSHYINIINRYVKINGFYGSCGVEPQVKVFKTSFSKVAVSVRRSIHIYYCLRTLPYGTGDGTRTRMVFPPEDFKSPVSTDSNHASIFYRVRYRRFSHTIDILFCIYTTTRKEIERRWRYCQLLVSF